MTSSTYFQFFQERNGNQVTLTKKQNRLVTGMLEVMNVITFLKTPCFVNLVYAIGKEKSTKITSFPDVSKSIIKVYLNYVQILGIFDFLLTLTH